MLLRRAWPARPTFESAFADLEQMRRDMLRRLEPAWNDLQGTGGAGVFPPMNITQDDDKFYLRAEIPGIQTDELSITALRNRVTISGSRQIPSENGRASYHRKERPEGAFSRTVRLPTEVDAERVEARYSGGILTLVMPKAEAAKPRQIAVKS
jgi:HSP20 family protein